MVKRRMVRSGLSLFRLCHIPEPAHSLGVPTGSVGNPQTRTRIQSHRGLVLSSVSNGVSRGRATLLDPGQVISLQNISEQQGHPAASWRLSLAASVNIVNPFSVSSHYLHALSLLSSLLCTGDHSQHIL